MINNKVYNKSDNYLELVNVLNKWIAETDDDLPKELTKDWYLRKQKPFNESSNLKTEYHGVRGQMPGSSLNAIKNNNKGPF